jgi:hypothetical protein
MKKHIIWSPLQNCWCQPAIRGIEKERHLGVLQSVLGWWASTILELGKHITEIALLDITGVTQKQGLITTNLI